MNPGYGLVQTKIAAIEAEMKRIGWWQDQPLKPEQYTFHQPFAMDTMTFAQWLQFIFIPRVNQIVDSKGVFPGQSMVAAQTVREFDGVSEASNLVTMLSEFDALFD